jgi:hypothetical protein
LKIRPTKDQAKKLVVQTAPQYVELFTEVKADAHGWLIWPDKLIRLKQNLKLEGYVKNYTSQKLIDTFLIFFLLGKQEAIELNNEMKQLSLEEQQKECEELTEFFIEDDLQWLDQLFPSWPQTKEDEEKAKIEFDKLLEEDKKKQLERLAYFIIYFFLGIHNYFSIMVHGEAMVSLVPKAINGDDEAFLKALKIDRSLQDHHPYFVDRIKTAKQNNEKEFLQKVATYQAQPNLKGRIKLPGVYIVFAVLDVINWLDDFTHEEILDLCDASDLDRWQNRIEDVNALTKQLARYRRYQRTGGVSMH